MAYPQPSNVAPWYLRNINEALQLDEVSGNVFMRTGIQGNVYVTGPVTIPGTVTVNSSAADPVHVHLDEIGTSGILTVPYMPIGNTNVVVTSGNISVSGNVGVTSLPAITGNVSVIGNIVGITSLPAITGNVSIVGNVNVTQGTNPWSVTGNVLASLTGNSLPDGKPWQLQVAQGQIPGVTGLSISGYQEAIPNSWTPVWEFPTAYTYFPSAQQVRIWSDSASDTNVTILVTGVNGSYAPVTEIVTLTNGTTGVLTATSFLRINNLAITQAPMNVGNISAGNTSKSITLATILPGAGRSQMSIYTVPAGYTFYLTQVNVYTNQVGSQTGLYRSYIQYPSGVINTVLTFPFVDQYNSTKIVPRPYPEKTDIQWQAQSSNNTSRVGIQIEGYLIAN